MTPHARAWLQYLAQRCMRPVQRGWLRFVIWNTNAWLADCAADGLIAGRHLDECRAMVDDLGGQLQALREPLRAPRALPRCREVPPW